jgi:hypothetical protein
MHAPDAGGENPGRRPRSRWVVLLRLARSFVAAVLLCVVLREAWAQMPSLAPFWWENRITEERSPDGAYVAAVFVGDNGALGDETAHVHLNLSCFPFRARYSSWDAPGLVAAGRETGLSLHWAGPRHLVVEGRPGPQGDTWWRDVTISYR